MGFLYQICHVKNFLSEKTPTAKRPWASLLPHISKRKISIRHIKEIQSICIRDFRVEDHSIEFAPGMRRKPAAGGRALSGDAGHALVSHRFCKITESRRKVIAVAIAGCEHLIGVIWLPTPWRPHRPTHISAVSHHVIEADLKLGSAVHGRSHAHAVQDIGAPGSPWRNKIVFRSLFCDRAAIQRAGPVEIVIRAANLGPAGGHLTIGLEIIPFAADGRPLFSHHAAFRPEIIIFPADDLPARLHFQIMLRIEISFLIVNGFPARVVGPLTRRQIVIFLFLDRFKTALIGNALFIQKIIGAANLLGTDPLAVVFTVLVKILPGDDFLL